MAFTLAQRIIRVAATTMTTSFPSRNTCVGGSAVGLGAIGPPAGGLRALAMPRTAVLIGHVAHVLEVLGEDAAQGGAAERGSTRGRFSACLRIGAAG